MGPNKIADRKRTAAADRSARRRAGSVHFVRAGMRVEAHCADVDDTRLRVGVEEFFRTLQCRPWRPRVPVTG